MERRKRASLHKMDAGCQCRHTRRILVDILGMWTRNAFIKFTQSLNNAVTAVLTILLVHKCRNVTNVPNWLWRVVPCIVAEFDQHLEKTCSLSLQG